MNGQFFTSKIRGTISQTQWAHDIRNKMLSSPYNLGSEALERRCEREGIAVDMDSLLAAAEQLTEAKFWIEKCAINPWSGIASALIFYKTTDAINAEYHKMNKAKSQSWR